MGKKRRNDSNFPLILTIILILSFILLIIFSLFFNIRLNLADLFYSPAGSGSYSSTASGLGFGSGSGSGLPCKEFDSKNYRCEGRYAVYDTCDKHGKWKMITYFECGENEMCIGNSTSGFSCKILNKTCCLCEYMINNIFTNSSGGVEVKPVSNTERTDFLTKCINFLKRPVCDTKILSTFNVSNIGKCNVPNSCKGMNFEYMYVGHSSTDLAPGFIVRTTQICMDCPTVKGIINGCQTFQDPELAKLYLDSIILPPGVEFELWGAQCTLTNKPDTYGGVCGSGSTLGCTVKYKCNIIYDFCPAENTKCLFDDSDPIFKTGLKCRRSSDGQLTTMYCCGPYTTSTNTQGILVKKGTWKSSCPTGSGQTATSQVISFFQRLFA